MLKAVVLDLDGTLLYTLPDIAAALNHALAECGFPTHTMDACRTFIGRGIMVAIRRALPAQASEADVDRVHTAYQAYYPHHCAELTEYYPGIRESLAALQEAGVQLAVLSNKTESTTRKVTAHYFPDIAWAGVYGRVPERPLKPDPAAASAVLEAFGLPAGEVAYVGDSGTDMEFARAAGMLAVAAPWGYRSREELVDRGAEIVVESAGDLARVLL